MSAAIEPYPTWERKQREAEELGARDLRDQFAMAALTSLFASGVPCGDNWQHEKTADICYAIADAMMARRDK